MTFHRGTARNCDVLGKFLELFAAFSAALATSGEQVMPTRHKLSSEEWQMNDETLFVRQTKVRFKFLLMKSTTNFFRIDELI